MKRTVWHHKEVFQSPPRGVFRSRFLWDSLVVFTLCCSPTILQASCKRTDSPLPYASLQQSTLYKAQTYKTLSLKQKRGATMFCMGLRELTVLGLAVLSDVSISSVMLGYICMHFLHPVNDSRPHGDATVL